MAIKTFTAVLALLSLACAGASGTGRDLLQAGTTAAPFDWGRPCTLLGSNSAVEITGPNNAACTPCGSGATATPEPTCTFKPLSFKVGDTISLSYHSSTHHLYLGNAACTFTTEICPSADAAAVTTAKPCTYKFAAAGKYYISDKSGANNADDGEYCKDFGAALPVTVS